MWSVSTASHGGIWLAPNMRERIPPPFNRAGWYEEDCEWSIPATFIPEAFPRVEDRALAFKTIMTWFKGQCDIYFAELDKEDEP